MNRLKIQFAGLVFFNILFGGFPEIITDIDGNPINLKELNTQKTVAVITMKSPDCPFSRPKFCASCRILTS